MEKRSNENQGARLKNMLHKTARSITCVGAKRIKKIVVNESIQELKAKEVL